MVLEECLEGEELVVPGDERWRAFGAAGRLPQDHKRVFDNDQGPNTGGMGAYSTEQKFLTKRCASGW